MRDAPLDVRKLAGVLGETDGLGTPDPRVVVGIGVNGDWPAADFPPELAGPNGMTSLREASGGRPIDRDRLLDAFLGRLEARVEALRGDRFDVAAWVGRQATTGYDVALSRPDGSVETRRAVGVDATSGALIVADPEVAGGERPVLTGEIVHLRLAGGGL
jgi:biotin-(acetyl-CoA carboxylase) ligase